MISQLQYELKQALEDKNYDLAYRRASTEDYLSSYNIPILDSRIDTTEDLIQYLEKHDGFSRRF